MATPPPEESRERVRHVLEQEVERIDSREAAHAVVRRIEQLAAGETEKQEAEIAAKAPAAAATQVEQAAQATQAAAPADAAAAVLATTAAQTVAPTPEAPAVLAAAQETLGTRPAPVSPAAQRGRSLLKEAVLEELDPLQALDARIFLAINGVPHPRWLDRTMDAVAIVTNGGWIWAFGVLGARVLGVPRSGQALVELLPSLAGATWIVEYPVKAIFRRRRPFIDIVRALVVGKRPGSWSFPSGHTASSFACAWVLSTRWPRRAPIFFGLASFVGFNRVYVGAHYPGDVTSGALCGMVLAELIRRGTCSVLRATTRG